MSKDTDGCAKDERGKSFVEAVGHRMLDDTDREIADLTEKARAKGVDEALLKGVKGAAESREDYVADLRVLAEPRGKRITPKTPKPPPYERELDPHEEYCLEEMLSGRIKTETVVG